MQKNLKTKVPSSVNAWVWERSPSLGRRVHLHWYLWSRRKGEFCSISCVQSGGVELVHGCDLRGGQDETAQLSLMSDLLFKIFHICFFFLCVKSQTFKRPKGVKATTGIGLQVWFQNARAKFRRNILRQENGGVDKADGSSVPPPSSDSGALTPPSSAATLTDLTNPSITVVTSVTSSLDSHDSGSPSQTTLTNLF